MCDSFLLCSYRWLVPGRQLRPYLSRRSGKFIRAVSCTFPWWSQVETYTLCLSRTNNKMLFITRTTRCCSSSEFGFCDELSYKCEMTDIVQSWSDSVQRGFKRSRILVSGTVSKLSEGDSSSSIVQFLSDLHTGANGHRTHEIAFWQPSVA